MAGPSPGLLAGRTAWVRNLAQPVRVFVATEVGSAAVLLVATLVALLWANSPWGETYEQVWSTELSIHLGDLAIAHDLRHWINDGLMAFFFFVVGLEIRRELDMGELRERRRVALPVLAGLGGMAVPALIYLSFNAGTEAVHGWGIVMATDTAFALAVLGLVGRRWPLRVRVFMLTMVVVDDVVALLVIALAYTSDISIWPLLLAAGIFAMVIGMRSAGVRHGAPYLLLGVALWLSLMAGGVHPTIAGVVMGLLATAYPPTRDDLQRAASLWRLFREQPTSEYARSASRGVKLAISPNERMQQLFHIPTSFLIVPLFALANAGVTIDGELLGRAVTSPITIGIVIALVVGKAVGITGASWLGTRRWLGGFPLTIAWPPLIGAGTIAGIGFTVSLFIAELTFNGGPLAEAKIGILTASVLATTLGWLVFRLFDRLPQRMRDGGRTRPAEPLIDLTDPVDPDRDHIRGPADAPVTLVEYGDFECPYCGQAEPVIRQLLTEFGGDLRYVFRHLPLEDVHEHAQQAAEAAEVAGALGKFWEMHDLLFRHQDALREPDLIAYADELGLDVTIFEVKLHKRKYAPRVARDVESADLSGVTGTPTVFINGYRYHGAFNLPALQAKVRSALAQKVH